jgi:hypothetical protein
VRRELDLFVVPLRRSVDASDEPRAMDPPEVSVNERVFRLRFVAGTFGEPEVPGRVLLPPVRGEVRVLVGCVRLRFPPFASHHVLAAFYELPGVCDCSLVHGIRGHARVFPCSTGTNLAEDSSLTYVVGTYVLDRPAPRTRPFPQGESPTGAHPDECRRWLATI